MYTYQKIWIIVIGIVITCINPVFAQKGIGSQTGLGQESEKPVIIAITGELMGMKTGPCENTTGDAYIGTHLFVKKTGTENLLNIHLGAAYAMESMISRLSIGHMIEMQVFRTEAMEADHYIAKQITANGYTMQLRDENLRPFWAGDSFAQRGKRSDIRRRGRW